MTSEPRRDSRAALELTDKIAQVNRRIGAGFLDSLREVGVPAIKRTGRRQHRCVSGL